MKNFTLAASLALALFANTNIYAQTFSENFEDESADARWATVEEGAHNTADFSAAYADLGIDAPAEGGSYCMKLEVNNDADDAQGFSFLGAYPDGEEFVGTYYISFDAYFSYGENGSTEVAVYGLGHDVELLSGFPSDGQDLALITDGSSSADVRFYNNGAYINAASNEGVYTLAGADNSPNLDATEYGIESGDPAKQWLKVTIEANATSVSYKINGVEWLNSAIVPTEGNALIGLMDFYSSVGDASFMLVDNVMISEGTLAIEDNVLPNVVMFPNPITNVLNVTAGENAVVTVLSITGNVIFEGKAGAINTQAWAKGLYFVQVQEGDAKKVVKVIK